MGQNHVAKIAKITSRSNDDHASGRSGASIEQRWDPNPNGALLGVGAHCKYAEQPDGCKEKKKK